MSKNTGAVSAEIPIEDFEGFAEGLDHPEGLAFDREGNLWAGGEAGQIYRMDPRGRVEEIANPGRQTITRVKTRYRGMPLAY